MNLPFPGPRSTLMAGLHYVRDPADFALKNSKKYGDPFIAPLPTGIVTVTGDPELIKEILTADSNVYETYAQAFVEPATGPNSLVLLNGERHRRERKLLMPPFHGERMRSYGTLMQQCVQRTLAKMKPGDTFDTNQTTLDMSIEVILRAVVGVEEKERVQRFIDMLKVYTRAYSPLVAMLKPLRHNFGGVGPWAKFQRIYNEFDEMLTEQLARRRAAPAEGTDILGLMMSARDEQGNAMSDVELKDELRTLLLAGHETTATSMAWFLYQIHRNPDVRGKLFDELAGAGPDPSPEQLVRLPYLNAAIEETVRMYPALAVLTRKLRTPFTLKGRELPVGMGLMPSVTLAHVNPDTFPEPERFRPERFLERKFSAYEYLPWGGGVRRCLGAAFATYEMKVVLGTLLASSRFTLITDRPVKVVLRNVMLGPKEPIIMRYDGAIRAAAAA